MQISSTSRAGLLGLVTVLHIAMLWWLASGASRPAITPPKPLPPVMVEILRPTPPPQPVARPEPPRPQPVTPPKARPQPVPQPVPRPAPVQKAPLPAPAPTPVPAPTAPAPAQAAPTPPAPPAPAAPAPAPVTATPPRFNAAYLSNPVPTYPAMLRRAGEEGRVVLRVFVTPEGTAGEVQVLKPASSPQFDEAAVNAVRKWRFVPAKRGEVPVAEWVQVPIEFKLN